MKDTLWFHLAMKSKHILLQAAKPTQYCFKALVEVKGLSFSNEV